MIDEKEEGRLRASVQLTLFIYLLKNKAKNMFYNEDS